MAAESENGEKKKLREKKIKEITFRCPFCKESRPLGEMVVITRLFPPLVACRECEKELR